MVVLGYHYSVLAPSVNNSYEAIGEEWGERHFGRHFLRKKSGAMRLYPTALFKLLLPVLMISCAYWARSYMAQLEGESRVILLNLPYLICVVALFLAYQFNRCRLMLASCAVAVFYWQVQSQLQVSLSEPEAARIYLAASLALPVISFYLLLLPERGIWNIYGLITTLAFIFLGLICIQLGAWLAPDSDAVTGLYAVRPADGYVLSYAATVLVALAALARHHGNEAAASGHMQQAKLPLAEMNYYSFLAADKLQQDYAFNNQPLVLAPEVAEPLQALPAVQRIGELHYHEEPSLAHSEWFKVLQDADDAMQQQQLAQLA